jgi:hypothetical protein
MPRPSIPCEAGQVRRDPDRRHDGVRYPIRTVTLQHPVGPLHWQVLSSAGVVSCIMTITLARWPLVTP